MKAVSGSQYGEDAILQTYFNGRRGGLIVDVGAADGVVNSNSYILIHDFGWSAILIEPLPEYAEALRTLYRGNSKVQVIEAAAGKSGTKRLLIAGQVSTLHRWFRDRVVNAHGSIYTGDVDVRCAPLPVLLAECGCPEHIDFLSIDCEGSDWEVLRSLNGSGYAFDMLCIELIGPEIAEYCTGLGLSPLPHTVGNSLFART